MPAAKYLPQQFAPSDIESPGSWNTPAPAAISSHFRSSCCKYNKRNRPCGRLPGAALLASDAVWHQFPKEPVKTVLPFPVIRLYMFLFTAANPPVGANAHTLGTHALHKDANEYMTCINKHSYQLNGWAICIEKQPCNPMYNKRASKSQRNNDAQINASRIRRPI